MADIARIVQTTLNVVEEYDVHTVTALLKSKVKVVPRQAEVTQGVPGRLRQCFSTFVRPRPGKLFFYKTRERSQQIYS